MRLNRLAVASVVASALSLQVMAVPAPAQTASAPAPAATAAAPANPAQQSAAKAVLADFFHGIFAGDDKALTLLYFSEPKNQPAAYAMFGQILAAQRLHAEVVKTFGAKANNFDTGMGPDEVADFEKDLSSAVVKVNDAGTSATVQMGANPTFVVVQRDGKWMVDFEATQKNMAPVPNDKEIASFKEKTSGYERLTKEVANKKYATVDDVTKEVEKIENAADKASAEPAAPTRVGG